MKKAILFFVLGVSAAVAATTYNKLYISWQNPTTRVDGSPFKRDQISKVTVDVDGVVIGTFTSAGIDKQSYEYNLKCWKEGRAVTITIFDKTLPKPLTSKATVKLPYKANAVCVK